MLINLQRVTQKMGRSSTANLVLLRAELPFAHQSAHRPVVRRRTVQLFHDGPKGKGAGFVSRGFIGINFYTTSVILLT